MGGNRFERKAPRSGQCEFIAHMNQVMPRGELVALIAQRAAATRAEGVRMPVVFENMLRIHFLLQWFKLSDPAIEAAQIYTPMFREFAGLDARGDHIRDESALLRFRRLPVNHNLSLQILATVKAALGANGLHLKSGTVVDASLTNAPGSIKNSSGERDPAIPQTKNVNQWHFGMHAHMEFEVGSDRGITGVSTTTNVSTVTLAHMPVNGKEKALFADGGYQGVGNSEGVPGDKAQGHMAMRSGKRKTMDGHTPMVEILAQTKTRIRVIVEHPFLLIKDQCGLLEVRCRGLLKRTTAQLLTLFAPLQPVDVVEQMAVGHVGMSTSAGGCLVAKRGELGRKTKPVGRKSAPSEIDRPNSNRGGRSAAPSWVRRTPLLPIGKMMSRLPAERWMVGVFLAMSGISLQAQTLNNVSVQAITDATCVGERAGATRSCTSNDFSTIVSVEQDSATALSRCLYGQSLSLNINAVVESQNPDRYDVAVFFGQTGNNPRILDTTQRCSIAMVAPTTVLAPQTYPPPSTPSIFPFFDADGDSCGDFRGKSFPATGGFLSGLANLRALGVKAACLPALGTAQVSLPYTVVFDNVAANNCSVSTVTAGTNAKCSTSSPEIGALVQGLTVEGYVRITKQTVPNSSTQSFGFTVSANSSPTATGDVPSTTSFALSHNLTQTVTVPLHPTGGTRTLVIQESLVDAWGPGASIVCTRPDGTAAPFVVVDNANRRITANLTGANGAAHCTIVNTRQTRVRTDKRLLPSSDPGRFNLTAGGVTVANLGDGGSTGWQVVAPGTAQTFSEAGFTGTSVATYNNSYECVRADATTLISSGTGTTTTLAPVPYSDTLCTFTNSRSVGLSITKTNNVSTLTAGSTTQYVITLANSGPSDAAGAVLTDPPAAGLVCTTVSCVPGPGTSTATCPSPLTVPLLQSGVSIPAFPAGSSLIFQLTCDVTASGVP